MALSPVALPDIHALEQGRVAIVTTLSITSSMILGCPDALSCRMAERHYGYIAWRQPLGAQALLRICAAAPAWLYS